MRFGAALKYHYSISGCFTGRAYTVVSVAALLGAFVMAAGFGAVRRRTGHRALSADNPLVQNDHVPAGAVNPHIDLSSRLNGSAAGVPVSSAVVQHKAPQASAALPLAFEPNQGQTDARVKYLSHGPGFTAFLTANEAVLKLRDPEGASQNATGKTEARSSNAMAGLRPSLRRNASGGPRVIDSVLRMQFVGADHRVVVEGTDELPGKTNYFRGRDPQKWQTNLANYARVQYENIYPGVSLLYYGNQGQLEYDFEVGPGGDPSVIRLKFPGGQQLHVDRATGDLLVTAGKSHVRFHQPAVYQTDDRGSKTYLAGRYFVDGWRRSVGFRVAPYDHRRTLVIDPTLGYSTYLGGSQDDEGDAIAVDSSGNVYVAGFTDSVDFPVTSGAFQTACGGGCSGSTYDAFVTKLNPSGSGLIYSTYLGGSQTDQGEGFAINAAGEAYVAGITYSSDFPTTPKAFQTACAGGSCANGEGFVTELNSTGSALVYSTYLGGSEATQANALALDSSDNLYVTGWTSSSDFPVTKGVIQSTCASCPASSDNFVTKLNRIGSALVYSTFVGGSDVDVAYAIALDAARDAYVVGYTQSTDFPTTSGAFQTSLAAPQAGFVTKLNPTASALVYSTYLGGSGTGSNPCSACAAGIAVDGAGEAYVSGLTWETNFPVTSGAFQTTYAGGFHDAFLTKLNAAGSALIYSTYIGGTEDDGAVALALDSSDRLYIRGNTFSSDFPITAGAFQTVKGGGADAFFTILNPAGSRLIYSTYLGGSGDEFGHATQSIALDQQRPPNAYLTGFTDSTNFPVTSGAFQTVFGGVYDAFVSKFVASPNVGLSPTSLTFGNQVVGITSPQQSVTLTNTGTTTLSITGVSFTGADAADFSQTNNCGSIVAAQTVCTFNVTFTPTQINTQTGNLSILDSAPGSPQTVALTGTGTEALVTPTSLDFGTQREHTASPAKSIRLANEGTSAMSITSITLTGSDPSDFIEANNCGSSLKAAAFCTITVRFDPSALQQLTAAVSISDSGGGSPQIVTLSGTGEQ